MKKQLPMVLLVLGLAALAPADSWARMGWGLRAGGASDPDMTEIGTHLILSIDRLDPNDPGVGLNLLADAEIGWDDFGRAYSINPGVQVPIRIAGGLHFYALGQLGITYYDFDGDTDNRTEAGAILGGGLQMFISDNFNIFGEAKFGTGDIPEGRFLAGFTVWNE